MINSVQTICGQKKSRHSALCARGEKVGLLLPWRLCLVTAGFHKLCGQAVAEGWRELLALADGWQDAGTQAVGQAVCPRL